MKTTPLLLFIPLLMTSGALASGQDDFNVQTASSRMVKHEDGSRSYFEKTGDGKGMKKTTYNIRNVLVSVTLYKRGPFGELRSCLIFDGQKNELFFVRYGYDGNANLREEQMFDSRTKELVRRFLMTPWATAASPYASRWSRVPRTLKRTPCPPPRKKTPSRTILKRKTNKLRSFGTIPPLPSFSVFPRDAESLSPGRSGARSAQENCGRS